MDTSTFSPSSDVAQSSAVYPYVPTATWPQVVEVYSVALGQEPNPAGPPVAVLPLPDGGELHIVATDDSHQLTQRTEALFLNLADAELVENAYAIALQLGATPSIPLQTIDVFPVVNSEATRTGHIHLTLASFTFSGQASQSASVASAGTDTTLGVIHNPNW